MSEIHLKFYYFSVSFFIITNYTTVQKFGVIYKTINSWEERHIRMISEGSCDTV